MVGTQQWHGRIGVLLWACAPAFAGQYQLMLGQAQSVPISAPVRNNETQCHLQLQVSDQPPLERVVSAPYFETLVVIRPEQAGPVIVRWMVTAKRTDAGVVNACPTEGQTELAVVTSNESVMAVWNALFTKLGSSMTECVWAALQAQQVRYEWFDLKAQQTSGEDAKINASLQQCEVFLKRSTAWGSKDPLRHACALPSGQKTVCEGYYAEGGKSGKVISKQQAIARQLQGLPWTTGVREQLTVKVQRLKREHDEEVRVQAQAAAQLEAQAKQQRDEEARLAAQAKAEADKAEAEKLREAQQKEQEEKERLEKRSWFAKTYDDLKLKVRGPGK
jgi:hypothetical protein